MTIPIPAPEDDPLFMPLTIDEAARFAGRTRRTIDQWIADGDLEVVQLEAPRRRVVVKRQLLDLEIRKRQAALRGRPRKALQPPAGEAS